MADPEKLTPLGASDEALSMAEVAGAVLGALWFGLVLFWWLAQPEGQGPGVVVAFLLLMLPLGLIWALVTALRSVRALKAEAGRLQMALDTVRPAPVPRPAAMREPGPPLREPTPPRDEQPSLGFDAPEPESELTVADYIVAVNFPDSEDDEQGIRALQMALADRDTAKLIRAAQDVLTLMSQDGVFMDDLSPEIAPSDVWRRFGAGERGKPIAQIGGVLDRNVLGFVGQRMRDDQIFRDAAHHFLRTFDRSFSAFSRAATDTELEWLAHTRTARAFMLLGRVTGTFD